MAKRLEGGIPLDEQSWLQICDAAEKSGMSADDIRALTE